MANPINQSGGYEGSHIVVPLSGTAGGTINFSYQMYTIPDNLVISTNLGVITNTGFVSGGSSGTLQLPRGATQVQIDLNTADQGTAWNYAVAVNEFHCPVSQQDLERARNSYIAARERYLNGLRLGDVDLLSSTVRDLEGNLRDANITIGLTAIRDYAGLFNSLAALALPPAQGAAWTLFSTLQDGLSFVNNVQSNPSQDPEQSFNNAIDGLQLLRSVIDSVAVLRSINLPGPYNVAQTLANFAVDASQANQAIQAVIDQRFEVADRLTEVRQRLDAAIQFRNNQQALYDSLVQQYQDVLDLYDQFNGQCPPDQAGSNADIYLPSATYAARTSAVAAARDAGQGMANVADAVAARIDVDAVRQSLGVIQIRDPISGGVLALGQTTADNISLLSGNNVVLAAAGNDVVVTGAGDDFVFGNSGNDTINGGGGTDVAGFAGRQSEYTVTTVNGVTTVVDSVSGRDGTDVLTNIEALYFVDGPLLLNQAQPPGLPVLVVTRPTATEGLDTDLVYRLGLVGESTQDVIVRYTVDGGAERQATIRAGGNTGEIRIPVASNSTNDGNRQVTVNILGVQNAVFLPQDASSSTVIGTIRDDDGPRPDLVVEQGPVTYDASTRTVSYALTVSNRGSATAQGAGLSFTAPAQARNLSVASNTGSVSSNVQPGSATGSFGDLAAGQTATVNVSFVVPGAGTYVGTAEARSSSVESQTSNNRLLIVAEAAPQPIAPADVSLVATGPTSAVSAATQQTFEFTVSNSGPGFASDLAASIVLPAGLTFVSASTIQGSYNAATGVWEIGNLAAGITRTITLTATVNATGPLDIVGEIIRAGNPDPDSQPNNGVTTEDDYALLALRRADIGSSGPDTGVSPPFAGPSDGNDSLVGTSGPDFISLLNGNDTYAGGQGNDTVFGNQGADLIQGNQGEDLLFGNQGNDTLFGGQGQDTLFGGQDADLLFGNLGADIVLGNLGMDTLFGGQGNDSLYGGQGDDVLFGDLGDDVLSGDLGNDVLRGGAGADRYVFNTNSGADVVLGFNQAEGDRLDLRGQTYRFGVAADGSGSALLVLSGGGTIELAGITQAQVNANFFA